MIEKLFTSRNRVKLLEYLIFRSGKGRLREISRAMKMPVSAVSRELKNLEELGIVKSGEGIYSLNKDCSYVSDLGDILLKTDSFKFGLEKIFHKKKIDFAFVFGSFANRNYNFESDIDIFVIGNISSFELDRKLKPVEEKLSREINLVVWPLDDLKSKLQSSFIKDISKKNLVMVKGKEDELRKIIGRK